MARGDRQYAVSKLFSKWFVDNKGTNRVPEEYAEDLRNVRIINNGISVRPWYRVEYEGTWTAGIQAITSNSVRNDLVYVYNNELYTYNFTTGTSTGSFSLGFSSSFATVSWTVPTTNNGSVWTGTFYSLINHGQYTIILTNNSNPYVWDGASLTQPSDILAGANPWFGARFAGFTVVENKVQSNTLLLSNPVTAAAPENAFDWAGVGAETLIFESKVVGAKGTTNNLWVFTETQIEYLGRWNISNTGGVTSIFTVPLSSGYGIDNNNVIVPAGDTVFFYTKSKQIGTVNYRQDVIEPQVNIISDDAGVSIQRFLDNVIDDDQSNAFGIYDRKQNLVKRSFRTNNSDVNDVILIYDIINRTFLIDDNKNFSSGIVHNERYYMGSATSQVIFEDEIWTSDVWQGINWYYQTQNLVFDKPPQQSVLWKNSVIGGQISLQTEIDREIRADNKTIFNDTIRGTDFASNEEIDGIGTAPIGSQPIGGDIEFIPDLQDFEREASRWRLRATGRKIRHRRSGNSLNGDFVLDYMTMVGLPRNRTATRIKTFSR